MGEEPEPMPATNRQTQTNKKKIGEKNGAKEKNAQPAEAASPLKGRENRVIMSVEGVKSRKTNREMKQKQTVWWQQLRQF